MSFWRPRAYFGVIFEVLEAPWGALGDLWVTFGSPWGPWGVQGRFFIDLGGSFWWPWASFLDRNHALDHDFSIHAFGVVPGSILNGFVAIQGSADPQKPCKFIVLSSNFKV